ncbi:MAG TPA: hypothetical protein VMJ73_07020 [Rhizomicrobium sp.]|nr:hypothetical protein [Rhizomicrobium sp.]
MRAFIFAAIFVAAATGSALAVGMGWHGPGWYVVMSTPVKAQSLYRGAYKTKEECVADKPADHGAISYDCVEYYKEPLDQ